MTFKKHPLPIPTQEYNVREEALTRRTVTDVLNTHEIDIDIAKTQADKTGSLAMRRFQFLLMGAS
tara:strand:+ start:11999 stop:12193 length:195 start_codon:yes stop_codon:yes gene_type:complete